MTPWDPRLDDVPTPALVYDLSQLRRTAAQLRALCAPFAGAACYAVKANRHPRILAELARAGLGADVASAQELALAADAGLTPLVATSPGLPAGAVRAVDELGGTVYFDHLEPLRAGGERRAEHGRQRRGRASATLLTLSTWRSRAREPPAQGQPAKSGRVSAGAAARRASRCAAESSAQPRFHACDRAM